MEERRSAGSALGKEYDNAQNEQQAAAIKQILQLFGISDTADENFQKEIGHTASF